MTDAVVFIVRVVAGVACVALFAAPALLGTFHQAKAWLTSHRVEAADEKAAAPTIGDMRLVLDLAARLKAAGCADGVALCQQLLDVMLGNSPKGKK